MWRRTCSLSAGQLVVVVALAAAARGQSIGYGSSPGRAAYRPPVQWNNGPYFTTPHIDPYAPHRASPTNQYNSSPHLPPYTTGPHGVYSPFYPGQGALGPYADGFSPYSGYAGWYRNTYGVVPTRSGVLEARALYFRSAPLPPGAVLSPLPPAGPVTISPNVAPPQAATPTVAAPAARVPVYRSSVAGMR